MAVNRKRWEMLPLDLGVTRSKEEQASDTGRRASACLVAGDSAGRDPRLAGLRSDVTTASSSSIACTLAPNAQPPIQSQLQGNAISNVTSKTSSESDSHRPATTSASKSTDPLKSGIVPTTILSTADWISTSNKPAKKYHVEAVKEQVKFLRADSERTEAMMKRVLATVEKMERNMKDMEAKYEERLQAAQRAHEVQLLQLRNMFGGALKPSKRN